MISCSECPSSTVYSPVCSKKGRSEPQRHPNWGRNRIWFPPPSDERCDRPTEASLTELAAARLEFTHALYEDGTAHDPIDHLQAASTLYSRLSAAVPTDDPDADADILFEGAMVALLGSNDAVFSARLLQLLQTSPHSPEVGPSPQQYKRRPSRNIDRHPPDHSMSLA